MWGEGSNSHSSNKTKTNKISQFYFIFGKYTYILFNFSSEKQIKNWKTHAHIESSFFSVKIALKNFDSLLKGFFFPTKAEEKKIPQKVLTHSFFDVFVRKRIFSWEIKKYETFGRCTMDESFILAS